MEFMNISDIKKAGNKGNQNWFNLRLCVFKIGTIADDLQTKSEMFFLL